MELGVNILGDRKLDVPGLGAGIEVAAGEAHGLSQQPAGQTHVKTSFLRSEGWQIALLILY